ncbi:hypothetical protein K438DRAFT_1989901 [Mycena galopus ATCC 62051]|nr:hypothetical protein K438DRAFT_1989901 [Mycena galopus ATCC 62051]
MLFPLLLSLVVCTASSFTFPTRLVLQSPTGLFLENLAVRPNGKLLITSPESSTLHMLEPNAENPTFDEVHTFLNVTLFGIAEVEPDVYGIIALVLNVTTISAVPGTIAIWRVDLSSGGPPVVNKAADVPNGMFLDGLGAVPGEPDLVLGADTAAGRVWQINLRTGVVRIAAQDDAFAPGAPAPAFGINGLHAHLLVLLTLLFLVCGVYIRKMFLNWHLLARAGGTGTAGRHGASSPISCQFRQNLCVSQTLS